MNIVCKIENENELEKCLSVLQNSMVKEYAFICPARSQKALTTLCEKLYLSGYAFLSPNQTRAYSMSTFTYPFGLSYGVSVCPTYMYSEKEAATLRCAAAKIAEKLLEKLPKNHSTIDCMNAVWKYVRSNFTYKLTYRFQDHSAYSLLERKSGVCQAFAALVCLILPFMGVPALYVSGEGLCKDTWVSHGWNAVRMEDGRWEQLDVTFSLDSLVLHTTATACGRLAFDRCHRCDTLRYNSAALESAYQKLLLSVHGRVTLDLNDSRFYMHGAEFNMQQGEPLFIYSCKKYGIDISDFFFILGGAAVYDGASDTLMVCLYDRFRYIRGASKFMLGDGYFDIRILSETGAELVPCGNKLEIAI